MSSFNGKAPYSPDYASYNWIGAPANYELTTNADLGGDSRTLPLYPIQFFLPVANIRQF